MYFDKKYKTIFVAQKYTFWHLREANKMTQQELLEAAKQGDPMAMCAVGDMCGNEYFNNTNKDGLEQAEEWYGKVIETNSEYVIYALDKLSKLKAIYARAYIGVMNNQVTADAEEDWEEVLKLAERIVKMLNDGVPGAQRVDRDKAVKFYYDVRYEVALCNYELKNYQLAIQLTKNIDIKKYKIIYWNSMGSMNKVDEAYAVKQLEFIYGDTEYGEAAKSANEEKLYFVSAVVMSCIYREGNAFNGFEKNINRIVKILNFVKNYLKNDGLKELLDEELAHYKQGFLGNWKYIQ